MKRVVLSYIFMILLIFLVACDEKAEPDYMDPYIAFEILNEELRKPNNVFDQGNAVITLAKVDHETETIVIGLLKLNKKTKKEVEEKFIGQILKRDVKLTFVEEGYSKLQ